MKKPSLTQELEQFLYTHAQNMPNKKLLLQLVFTWEKAYLDRIEELETKPLVAEFERMVNEGGPAATKERRCDCAALGHMAPCTWCEMSEEEYENYELGGTRY